MVTESGRHGGVAVWFIAIVSIQDGPQNRGYSLTLHIFTMSEPICMLFGATLRYKFEQLNMELTCLFRTKRR